MTVRTPSVSKTLTRLLRLLSEHPILTLAALGFAGAAVILWHLSRVASELKEAAAMEGAGQYSEMLAEFRTLYTSEVVERLRPLGVEVTHDYASKEGAIPLPATLSLILGERIGKKGSPVLVRLFSDYPFPWRKDAGPNKGFQEEALSALRQHPERAFARFEEVAGHASLRYATADRMRPQCVGCHNSHPQSPKTDWEVGDVRGVLEVILPMDNVEAVARTGFKGTFFLMTALTVLGLGLLAVVIHGLRQSWETERQLEAQLRHSKRLETIGTMAGGIAHDFNNILTPILGYANMALQDTPSSSETHSDLQHVVKGARRAKDLVNQILTFSRQGEQERKMVEISDVVAEALKLLRASLPSTIEFRESIDTQCGSVLADPTQIHQVLMNLCANAFHAMKEKGGVLEVQLGLVEVDAEFVRLHTNLHQGTHARLAVSDTGQGMDRETSDRIFDPFFTTKDVGEGTGLGLSVVHGIVRSHGGEITVYSEPGVGTTFHVYIPQSEGEVEEETAEEKAIETGEERVLFVDDDEEVAQVAGRMLRRLGYDVTVHTSSLEARDTFRHNPGRFDIVITDQTMPKMTGVELAKELLSIRPDLPIILISGFSQMFTAEKVKSVGIREFIMKPIVAAELSQAIRRALEEEQG